jgi:hypothetical protein
MKMSTIRIATVTETGKRYVIKQLQFGSGTTGTAYCWGECVSHKGLNAKFESGQTFRLDQVTVKEVERTTGLLSELVAQRIGGLRAAGHTVTMSRTGRTYTDHGTPEQQAKRREEQARFQEILLAAMDSSLKTMLGIRDDNAAEHKMAVDQGKVR